MPLESEAYQRRIWRSMQDELCSYIERDKQLPYNMDDYLDSFLKNEKILIPQELINEMQRARQQISDICKLPIKNM